MDPSPSALLAIGILGFVPGFLVYRAFRPTGFVSEAVAIAPVLSFGFVFVLGEIVAVATCFRSPSLPRGPGRDGRGGGAAVVADEQATGGARTPALEAEAAALLAGGVFLVAGSWVLGIRALGSTPPYTDSSNHGLMAAQAPPMRASIPGPFSGRMPGRWPPRMRRRSTRWRSTAKWPWRTVSSGSASPTDSLSAATMVFSVFVLPPGLFLAVRRLVPENPLLAGLAALLGATIGFFPVLPLSFGGLPLVIGLAMVPAVAVAAGRYLTGAGSLPDAAIVAFGAVGILATHTSEVPFLALFLGPVLAEASACGPGEPRRPTPGGSRSWRRRSCCSPPTLPLIAGGTDERSGIDEGRTASLGDALGALRAVVGQGGADVVAVLALVGVGLCLRRRRHLPRRRHHRGHPRALRRRLRRTRSPPGRHGAVVPASRSYRHEPGPSDPLLRCARPGRTGPALVARGRGRAGFAPAVLVAGALALAGFSTGAANMRTLFHERVVVGADAEAGFAYLEAVVQPGERVLNDANTDGSMWMYPFRGVVPLLGLRPARSTPSWDERVWLIENLPAIDRDPRVRELLRTYNVRHVYFDDRTFSHNPHHVDGEALRNTAAFCPRFSRGTVRVYEIVGPPGCPAPT